MYLEQLPNMLGGYQFWSDIWVRSGWRVQEHAVSGTNRLLDPRNRCVFTGAAEQCLAEAARSAPAAGRRSAVILLHGMGRTKQSMNRMARAMEDAGHAVANIGYASLLRPLDSHVATAARAAAVLAADGAEKIHFVGHSLGGFVARRLSAEGLMAGARVGRIVLLAVPNKGAALADCLKNFPPYKAITGACGQAVTTRAASAVPVPDAEILVIAGGNGKRGYNPMLRGDNDGIVTVAETRLGEAEADFLRVPSLHTSIMLRQDVIAATRAFIATGKASASE